MKKLFLGVLWLLLFLIGVIGSPFVTLSFITINPILSGMAFGVIVFWSVWYVAKKMING
jgi:hypothetical protein